MRNGVLPLKPLPRTRLVASTSSERATRDREDRELIRRCQNDPDDRIRAQAVEAFMPLVRSLARRYRRGEEPLEDLEQVAVLGLLGAIKRFNPDRGTAFASFAVPTIAGELRRHFRDKGWVVHVPRDLQERCLAVRRATQEMATTLGRAPTVSELGVQLGHSDEEILQARQAMHAMRPASLDRQAAHGDDDDDRPMNGFGDIDPGYQRCDDSVTIDALLSHVPERERQIIELRYAGDLTQSEIGARLGISQMHVSRLLRRTLQELGESAPATASRHRL